MLVIHYLLKHIAMLYVYCTNNVIILIILFQYFYWWSN